LANQRINLHGSIRDIEQWIICLATFHLYPTLEKGGGRVAPGATGVAVRLSELLEATSPWLVEVFDR
jgi:hypothetical protein